MNGSSTGLVATDASNPVDVETSSIALSERRPTPTVKEIADIHEWLISRAEWQTARGLVDAWERSKSEVGEGQRSREAVYGEDSQAPKVS